MGAREFLKDKTTRKKIGSGNENGKTISRRDFLKYGVGVAAVAAGATALMGKIPLPLDEPKAAATPARNGSEEPIVAAVHGDQLTVMNGQASVKVKDPLLAALIAGKLETGN